MICESLAAIERAVTNSPQALVYDPIWAQSVATLKDIVSDNGANFES